MKKQVKEQLLKSAKYIVQVADSLEKLLKGLSNSAALNVLAQMQDLAIQIGNTIEDSEGAEHNTVKKLEAACEVLYQISCSLDEPEISKKPHVVAKTKKSMFLELKNLFTSVKEEIEKNGMVVFEIKKHRIAHLNSTACYLKKDDKVLMIKFSKKWGQVYAPPGGKFESGETPLDCIIREFYEETGLTLINPKLQGISYWKDSMEGIIFIYTADEFTGKLKTSSVEGTLEWIEIAALSKINQFDQNEKFTPYLFKDKLFEGKFLLDDKCSVIKYEIREM